MISAWPTPSALASIQVAPVADTLVGVGNDASPRWYRLPPSGPPVRVESGARLAASTFARLVALTWCWMLVWLALWSLVPMLAGWSPVVVTSGSMNPALPIGSVVHVDRSVDLSAVGVGSIISFDAPGTPGTRITHRVTGTERSADGTDEVVAFRTKGDANVAADTMAVPVANVDGVARLVLPYAGLPKAWSINGDWLAFGGFMILTIGASMLSIDTLIRFISSDVRRPTRGGRRRTAAIAIAIAAMLGAPSTGAAFSASTVGTGTQFSMTSQWFIDAIDRDAPVAHWRLGEPSAGAPSVAMTDTFETFAGWTNLGSGSVVSSSVRAHTGLRSGLKTSNNDPNGGWKPLPAPIANDFVFEIWVYRPGGYSGGAIDRMGLEDSSFNGYTFNADHGGNTLRIDRRTGGSATGIGSSVSFNPPEDAWYRLRMTRVGTSITLNAFDTSGAVLASTSATDSTTTAFDRVSVRGGWDYYIDDLKVSAFAVGAPVTAADRVGTLPGTYAGGPTSGRPGLVTNDGDTAVRFDGIDDIVLLGDSTLINTTTRDQRTVELWFVPERVTGRQVLYEEGGGTNGLNIYLDGAQLYATAWTNSWTNQLITIAPTSMAVGVRHHVAVTLDAVTTKQLTMYLDGVAVATSSKTDSGSWAAHTDDGGIGAQNSDTRFHDGTASGGGNNFAGTIDEVVLFNSTPSAAHIADHFVAGR